VDGDKRIASYRKLYLTGEQTPYLFVRAGISLKTVIADANRGMLRNLSILSAFVVIAFAVSVVMGKRSIADRVGKLQLAAKRISGGDLQARVSDSVTGGELGALGIAFDDMAHSLEMRISERQKAEEALAVKQMQLEGLNQSLEERIETAIAELRQKDQILIQQGRLAAMGEMLNNIAHQWRQPLNNIGLIVQNLQDSFACGRLTNAEMDESIENALNVIMHMSGTIDDFRNFFRHDKEKREFAINDVVSQSIKFVEATLKSSNIELDVAANEYVAIFGYKNEYSQVLLNIINNARDVLLERDVADPRIRIRVFRENGFSVVTISDNGGGIDSGILPKIFDPYFTTKEKTQGTGIGLYMSKAIIEKNMGGSLTACNVGGGAEFRIEV
jgi:C4-dicarboxylate-specific signal transduction histidine kinase